MTYRRRRIARALTSCTALFLVAICIPAPAEDLGSLTLEQLLDLRVEGAALHTQTLEDAPASVSILTAEDIRKYGYRTLGEALASVRGFSMNTNRTYATVGARGFGLPGDYASRIIVMVNGHNMADNIFDSMLFFDQGFPVDMTLVKRIEIIRGPSSALYGSNGVFATINVITKSPGDAGPPALIADAGSFGEKQGQVMAAGTAGEVKAMFSASVLNSTGESPLFFPEFDTAANNFGQAIRMDGARGYHLFSSLAWRNWTITASFAGRRKIQPISWGDTIFNDRGTYVNDARDYIEAAYARALAGGTLRWRVYYDDYQLNERADFPLDSGVEDNRTVFNGKWLGTQVTDRFNAGPLGTLTVGAEGKVDLRNTMANFDVVPTHASFVNISSRDQSFALFAQDERRLSRQWTLDLGLRLDHFSYLSTFLAPRVALIFQPSPGWTYKFLYGRGFRNPSAYELYYEDGLSAVANPQARAESADTVEVDLERKLGKRLNLAVAGYGYLMRDFLEPRRSESGLIQYHNVGRIHASGVEVELNGRPAAWLEATASYAFQKSADSDADSTLENSPHHLAKLRFALPLGRKFDVSSSMQYVSSVRTLAGGSAGSASLADFTLTSRRLLPNFDFRLGIRNAFNRSYSDPIALTPRVDTMLQTGRSFFVELIAHGAR